MSRNPDNFNTSGAQFGIFWDDYINTMAADALMTQGAATVLTQQDTCVTVFHEKEFQLAKPPGIIWCMRPANERRRYTVTSSLIGWAHKQNDPWPWQCWGMMGNINTFLTHWGRVTHICLSKLTINPSDNGLSPDRRQAIIWTSTGIWLIGPLGTNFSEILIEIITFSFKKMHLKVSSAKWRPCCLGLNVLNVSLKTIQHQSKTLSWRNQNNAGTLGQNNVCWYPGSW